MEKGLTKARVIAELTRSPHGALTDYVPVGKTAASEDAEFFAHLVAWNHERGQIRDAKVALPILSLTAGNDPAINENALAHLAMLDPRNLVRAVRFAISVKPAGKVRAVKALVEQYLRVRERQPKWLERTLLQHRQAMKELYALCHIKPSPTAKAVLFDGQKVGLFKLVADLPNMSAAEAAGTILNKRIPFLVAVNALGAKAKDPALVMALIQQMSPTELVTNVKMLERLGVKTVPELRAAFEQKLAEAATSQANTFKTARAAEAVQDTALREKLHGLQEKQIKALAGIDGNWLVLGDKSSSMTEAIEASRMVAGTLAKMVKGEVHLVFFDSAPRYVNATGKDYDAIKAATRLVVAQGSTSIGCGVAYANEKGLDVDGIAIVSDGAENTVPAFTAEYERLCARLGKVVPVYLYWVKCHQPNDWNNNPLTLAANMTRAGHDLQVYDLRAGVDMYSLPNVAQTMRTNKYSLVDEIMAVPLKTLADVLDKKAA